MLSELTTDPKLCPDTDSFKIEGGVSIDPSTLLLFVLPNNSTWLDTNLNSVIVTSEMSRYFNAADYTKNGYQNPITLSETTVYPKNDTTIEVSNYISKTTIEFFDFMWLDTSAITFTDFGQELDNYKVDKSITSALALQQNVSFIAYYYQSRE